MTKVSVGKVGYIAIIMLASASLDCSAQGAEESTETVHAALFDIAETFLKAWLILRVFRFNPFPYLLLYYYQTLLPAASVMTASGWPALSGGIILLWSAAAAPLILAAVLLIRHRAAARRPDCRSPV